MKLAVGPLKTYFFLIRFFPSLLAEIMGEKPPPRVLSFGKRPGSLRVIEGVKKTIVADMSVRGGGGVNPLFATKYVGVFCL